MPVTIFSTMPPRTQTSVLMGHIDLDPVGFYLRFHELTKSYKQIHLM